MTWLFLKYVPKNTLSRYVGSLVHVPLPRPLSLMSMRAFAKHYNINLEEAEFRLEHYKSIGDLFTRKLKPGARPISSDLVHPVDGNLTEGGEIEQGRLIQAKGFDYSVEGLLAHDPSAPLYRNFGTYYLCPTDYHRVHAPLEGKIKRVIHVPGQLWPVNSMSVQRVPYLFSVNERVIMIMETFAGPVAVVMVGATNVGKITLSFDPSVVTNQNSNDRNKITIKSYEDGISVRAGDELGIFNMGSTVITLFGPKIRFPQFPRGPVKMGQSLPFVFS